MSQLLSDRTYRVVAPLSVVVDKISTVSKIKPVPKFIALLLFEYNKKPVKMVKCVICNANIAKQQLKIECTDCKAVHHANCANLSKSDIDYINAENQIWRCISCSKSRRQSMALESSIDEGKVTILEVIEMLKEAKEDRRRLESELGKSLETSHEKIDQNMKLIEDQTHKIDDYIQKIEQLHDENKQLKSRVKILEDKLEDAEQYSRLNSVEIQGIPEIKNEDTMEIVKKIGVALDMPIKEEMVDTCHRLRKRTDGKPATLIVKFVRRIDKHALLQKRRVKGTLTTAHMGYTTSSPVYINECLTFQRRKLFAAARELKTEKNYRFLWVRDGRILMRKEENAPVVLLTRMEDINKL